MRGRVGVAASNKIAGPGMPDDHANGRRVTAYAGPAIRPGRAGRADAVHDRLRQPGPQGSVRVAEVSA